MPAVLIVTTPEELLDRARALSKRVLELADLSKNPLAPGETPDARRHQIAKHGKALAEAFVAVDQAMQNIAAQMQSTDVTADAPPDDSNAN